MYFKQFYLGCLAYASYLTGSDVPRPALSPEAVREAAMRLARVGLEVAGHPVEKEGADECAEASPSSSRP